MADLNSGDLFAINRGGEDYKVSLGDLVRYLTAEEPFDAVSKASWLSADDEFLDGEICKAKTAVFAGGSVFGNSFRYRWQTQDSPEGIWEEGSWTFYDNTATEIETPTLKVGQQIKLQCQAQNTSNSIALQNSTTPVKNVAEPPREPMPWDGHDGGIFHIKDVTMGNMYIYYNMSSLADASVTAWKLDGTSLGSIDQIEPDSEDIVFVTNQNCTNLFNTNLSAKWKFGELTDVSKVTNMSNMFNNAPKFNFNISKWNVANVTNMSRMFWNGRQFNQDLSSWEVGNVTNMSNMFSDARKFNKSISNWNVGNVTNVKSMFNNAYVFNQPISNWDVGNVTNMNNLFWNAKEFNQDLSSWCVDPEPAHQNFNKYSAMPEDGSYEPKWGTCPKQ